MANSSSAKTGVILMTYGSATTAEHTAEYLNHVYKGKASPELIADFEERYRLVGHSPLIEITKAQSLLLEEQLGSPYVVEAGMRHSEPFIARAVAACRARGATRLIGIILSPQFSPYIMEGYRSALADAAAANGFKADNVRVADAWPTQEHFIELLAKRTSETLAELRAKHRTNIPVVFTTHSLPKRVVEKDDTYLRQIDATIQAVIDAMGEEALVWYAGYQSAGHTPEEWLKPDLVDILAKLHKEGYAQVLIVPVQFLADHLEILYDLDIAGREQCAEYGIEYNRIELPNTDPLFIEALASIVRHTNERASR